MNIYVISDDCIAIKDKIIESCKFNEEVALDKNDEKLEKNDAKLEKNIIIDKNDDKLEKNITTFWKWIPIEGSLSKKMDDILELLKQKIDACTDKKDVFKEIFIIENKNISEDSINEFFDKLNDLLDENGEYYHPFIIFLTKEEIFINEDDYYNIDIKKINSLFFPEDKPSISKIVFKLIQICSYYNELGDYFEINGFPYQSITDIETYPTYVNIMVMGRSQSGKSTFINLLLKEKRAKEGGNSCGCTEKSLKYKVLNYPIRLYDTIGFGDEDKNVEDIRTFFKKMDEELLFSKEKIHLILYFIDGGAGNKFSKNEKILLEEIQKRKILTFYIVNKFEYNPDKNLKKYNNEIKKIYKSLKSFIGSDYFSPNEEENLNKFIGVNLVKKNDKPSFGFKSIINKIYTYFKKESQIIIEIKEKNISSWDDIFSKLKNNFFFNQLDQYQEIEQKYEQESRNAIKKLSKLISINSFIPIYGDIFNYFIYDKINEKIKNTFKINKDLSYFIKYFKQRKDSIKDLPNWFKLTTLILFPLLLGTEAISENEKLLIRYQEEFRKEKLDLIFLLMDSIIQGIDYFEKYNQI